MAYSFETHIDQQLKLVDILSRSTARILRKMEPLEAIPSFDDETDFFLEMANKFSFSNLSEMIRTYNYMVLSEFYLSRAIEQGEGNELRVIEPKERLDTVKESVEFLQIMLPIVKIGMSNAMYQVGQFQEYLGNSEYDFEGDFLHCLMPCTKLPDYRQIYELTDNGAYFARIIKDRERFESQKVVSTDELFACYKEALIIQELMGHEIDRENSMFPYENGNLELHYSLAQDHAVYLLSKIYELSPKHQELRMQAIGIKQNWMSLHKPGQGFATS